MAKQNPTESKRPTPPTAGSRPSVRVDQAMSDDLAVLMSAGGNASNAVRAAVAQMADMYRTAWAHGVCPPGTAPRLLAYQLEQRPTSTPGATSGYDAASDNGQTPRAASRKLPHAPVGSTFTA